MDTKDWSPRAKKHMRKWLAFCALLAIMTISRYWLIPNELTPDYFYEKIVDTQGLFVLLVIAGVLIYNLGVCERITRKDNQMKIWEKEDLDELDLRVEALEKEVKRWR